MVNRLAYDPFLSAFSYSFHVLHSDRSGERDGSAGNTAIKRAWDFQPRVDGKDAPCGLSHVDTVLGSCNIHALPYQLVYDAECL